MADIILYAIISFIVIEFIVTKTVDYLNLQTWNQPIPDELKDLYNQERLQKARAYAKENFQLRVISSTLSLVLIIGFLWCRGFAWIDEISAVVSPHPVIHSLVFFAILGFGSFVWQLPFSVYSTFVIEQKFGFNKTTISTFIADTVKSLLLGTMIGGGLLALLVYLFQWLGNYFWLAGWITVSAFTVFFATFYTSFVLPLFNKLKPLESGNLRTAIEKYASRVSFPLTNILVMDGSKRSTKANAFFSGLGSKKNIVLYDTLIQDLSEEEITAVLAHEVGHYKKKHIIKFMLLSIVQSGILFFLFGWLAKNPVMADVLGASKNNFHLSLITFSLLYSPVSLITGIFMNMYSRKNEYEADAFAKQTFSATPLISALKKLTTNQLGNPCPHPAFIFLHYSHPTLLQRIQSLSVS
jgi:STE24 endopeptidase